MAISNRELFLELIDIIGILMEKVQETKNQVTELSNKFSANNIEITDATQQKLEAVAEKCENIEIDSDDSFQVDSDIEDIVKQLKTRASN